MILQALAKYYEVLAKEGKASKPGWCKEKVSYAINLSKEGEVLGILSLKTDVERGKKTVWVPVLRTVPERVTRSSGVAANFLCDNCKYLLGIDRDGADPRTLECFEAAKKKHVSCLEKAQGDMAQAVLRYFENWEPQKAKENPEILGKWEELTEGGNLIFCMGAMDAQEDAEIQEAWETYREQEEKGSPSVCLVTGKRSGIARIHRPIRGVPGAQPSGAALVSFNAPAFESYGKEQSYNAPVGEYGEFAYTTALNTLLAQREDTVQLGDAMVVFWAEDGKKEYQDLFLESIDPPQDNIETIRDVFEKIKRREPIRQRNVFLDPEQRFSILGVAPNAARLSVRFFYQNSFGNILRNVSRHYERMDIVKPAWEEREMLGINAMLEETVNKKSRNKKPVANMAAMVFRSVLEDGRYPASLYTDVLMRIRAEQGKGKVTWGRAGIIKACLIKNYGWTEGEYAMKLKEENNRAPYVLGRIFSELESIQKDANPGIKATIRERYFNSACASPASVFPVLLKLKNSHLKKLERERAGVKINYEKSLTDLMGRLEKFPTRLSLEEQGEFILGYYHQTQKHFEKKEEK